MKPSEPMNINPIVQDIGEDVVGFSLVPIRKPAQGELVTHAFRCCGICGDTICTWGGPDSMAICLKCVKDILC